MRTIASRVWIVAALGLAGCGGDEAFTPSVETVAGAYAATTLTVTENSVTVDLLDLGAELTLTLAADGSVTGRLFVPDGAEDGGDLDVALSGTWSLDGATVRFTMPEDTFVRDVAFTAERDRLTAEETFSDEKVRLTLTRTA